MPSQLAQGKEDLIPFLLISKPWTQALRTAGLDTLPRWKRGASGAQPLPCSQLSDVPTPTSHSSSPKRSGWGQLPLSTPVQPSSPSPGHMHLCRHGDAAHTFLPTGCRAPTCTFNVVVRDALPVLHEGLQQVNAGLPLWREQTQREGLPLSLITADGQPSTRGRVSARPWRRHRDAGSQREHEGVFSRTISWHLSQPPSLLETLCSCYVS